MCLDTLTDREEMFTLYVLVLDDGRTRTLEDVGKVCVYRERIRQIEAKGFT